MSVYAVQTAKAVRFTVLKDAKTEAVRRKACKRMCRVDCKGSKIYPNLKTQRRKRWSEKQMALSVLMPFGQHVVV